MPHLSIQYSPQLDDSHDMAALCHALSDAIMETALFPVAGIRVRAFRAEYESVADRHPENAFVAMQMFIGQGRTLEEQQQAGTHIYAAAEAFFADRLSEPYFMLSMEIFENQAAVSWKRNTVHPRLKRA
ncbi:MAG: 5-carboxymethyl-2-hydroxymuconate isomerase [Alphaproteobacteria bacterium]|jgi:5-carboxymethyl-2-hydroxymuconate isomerase